MSELNEFYLGIGLNLEQGRDLFGIVGHNYRCGECGSTEGNMRGEEFTEPGEVPCPDCGQKMLCVCSAETYFRALKNKYEDGSLEGFAKCEGIEAVLLARDEEQELGIVFGEKVGRGNSASSYEIELPTPTEIASIARKLAPLGDREIRIYIP